MNVIILAGGFGTRLHSITKDKYSKCMIDVNGKPFLYYLMNSLSDYAVEDIILSVGHKHEQIMDYFGCNFNGTPIIYSIEDEPLGTGGAIKKALELSRFNPIIVMNGDTLTGVNIDKLISFHNRYFADVTIAVKKITDASRFGSLEIDKQNKITKFNGKGTVKPGYINIGVYAFERQMYKEIKEKCSIETDYFPTVENIYAYKEEFNFIDIGIPKDYERFKSNKKII